MGLIIRSSTIHAAGCYTTAPIRQGTRIVEYTGPRLDKEIADQLYENRPITYLFGIGDGSQVIDGHGMAMFINHSCDANCETEEIDGRIWITAIRDIQAGEELCYDYCLYDGDEDEAPCNCGARRCRGSMYSPDELKRRKPSKQQKSTGTNVAERPAVSAKKMLHQRKSSPKRGKVAKRLQRPTVARQIESRSQPRKPRKYS